MLLQKQIYFIFALKSIIALYCTKCIIITKYNRIRFKSGYKFSNFCCTQQTITSGVKFMGDTMLNSYRYIYLRLSLKVFRYPWINLSGICSFCVNGVVVQKKVIISFINNNSYKVHMRSGVSIYQSGAPTKTDIP